MNHADTHNSQAGGLSSALDEADPLIPFDVRDQTGRRGLYILMGAIVALLILATLLFITYQPGTRDRAVPPRVKADNQPFKVLPANPGGAQTPDQDKSVYDVMAGKTVQENVVTSPGSETPIELPKSANIQVEPPKAVLPNRVTETIKVAPPRPVAPAPSPAAAAKPVSTAAVATGSGNDVVQIASVRSQGAAQDVWAGVSDKYSDLLVPGLYSDIVQVDLGDKGIYHRLRIAGLANKDAAKRLCAQFKARGQACLVTKR